MIKEELINFIETNSMSDMAKAAAIFAGAYCMSCLISGTAIVLVDAIVFIAFCFAINIGMEYARRWFDDIVNNL